MQVVNLIVGLISLLLGRQVFWLFVAIVGFLLGITLAPQYLAEQPQWVIIVVAVIAGLIGAVLAIFLQYAAVGLAGFFGGGSVLVGLLNTLGMDVSPYTWVVFVIGGIIGAVLMLLLFDPALIVLSSFVGAQLIVRATDLTPPESSLLFFGLVVVGIIVQAALLRRFPATQRRPVRRRVRRRT